MPLNVVYIDDESDMCQMFIDNFQTREIRISTFSDFSNIVHDIESVAPDLVIIDYRLPNMTGDCIARSLDPKLPKVLISGDLVIKPEQDYIRIFNKPFNFSEMESFLDELKKLAQQKSATIL